MRQGYITKTDAGYLVGAKDDAHQYKGPVAEITADSTWLYVSTDPYEGTAMLNIEALPFLIEALTKIAAGRDSPSPPLVV